MKRNLITLLKQLSSLEGKGKKNTKKGKWKNKGVARKEKIKRSRALKSQLSTTGGVDRER